MKKVFLVLILFLFPCMVYAEELPRDKFAYFMTYPNGEEIGTGSYEEASANEERLIYSDYTNSNGEVVLKNWDEEGIIRVEYETTSASINLSQKRVEIVNGLVNPSTGQNMFYMILCAAIMICGIIFLKGKKKLLLIIPISLGFVSLQTYASDNFTITVKDQNGNRISHGKVNVYAKATNVKYHPAIKYDANGGLFFDGSTEFYMKIPYDGCTNDEWYEYWNTEDRIETYNKLGFIYMNMTRDGYYIDYSYDEEDYERDDNGNYIYRDGTTIYSKWIEDENATVLTFHGNGGYYNFYGKQLDTIRMYKIDYYYTDIETLFRFNGIILMRDNYNQSNYQISFEHKTMHQMGWDISPEQSTYDSYGNMNSNFEWIYDENIKDLYACWYEKPDGFYVNDIFAGNITCFNHGSMMYSRHDNYYYYFVIAPYNNMPAMGLMKIPESNVLTGNASPIYENVEKFELQQLGEIILTLDENDLEEVDENTYIKYITNEEKIEQLEQIMTNKMNMCNPSGG